ncbi:MAG: type II toxin-antitoxin system RelE/ParE family toxin [Pyrinomonadaceae bacterium]|nr:type II toxin-antitoxin system RelE/ParE family toxin [Pyrinomonadaceae bacterium]MBP6212449.1 type II toxin-antitoxin system RelE/ParE family toxin [Pyrinomonadaceae bacterium]
MTYSFHPDAETEFFEAIEYYEDQGDEIGLTFSREVFAGVKRIMNFPMAWSPFSGRSRPCLVKRFPYGIVYRLTEDQIIIYAVMHLNRKPGYWLDRLK